MTTKIKFFMLLALLCTGLLSCTEEAPIAADNPYAVAKLVDGKIDLAYSDLQIRNIFSDDFEGLEKIDEWNLQPSGDHFYLIARGWKPGSTHRTSVAYELDREGDLLTFDPAGQANKVKHTCTGQDCNCCDFVKDQDDKIVGCYCNTTAHGVCTGKTCLHTVEEVVEVPMMP